MVCRVFCVICLVFWVASSVIQWFAGCSEWLVDVQSG